MNQSELQKIKIKIAIGQIKICTAFDYANNCYNQFSNWSIIDLTLLKKTDCRIGLRDSNKNDNKMPFRYTTLKNVHISF